MLRSFLSSSFSLAMALCVTACAGSIGSSVAPNGGVSPVSLRMLPPEPDPTVNNATVAGVDSNHDGIRDDVERWLDSTYGADVHRLAGARKEARGLQRGIAEVDLISEETRLSYSKKKMKDISCFIDLFGGTYDERQTARKQIANRTFNTMARAKANSISH